MRLLYDHQAFSLQDTGGITRYHFELIRQLAKHSDVDVNTIIGFSNSILPIEQLRQRNVRVGAMRMGLHPGLGRYALNEAVWLLTAPCLGRHDVYHTTYNRFLPLVRACKRVATHHDCVPERFPELFDDADRTIRAKRKLFASADAIVCVSESSLCDLVEFYRVDPGRTRVIHHGLNALPRSPEAATEVSRLVRREYIMTVGTRVPYKNFGGLLKAYAELELQKHMDLLVVGGGPLGKRELSTIEELGIRDSIKVVPRATDVFLAESYAGAQLFVYPSLYEGFGFPPLEAMSLGCPVLVSNTSSLPEICRNAAFYFDPSQSGGLAHSLKKALGDTEARSWAVQRGKEVASTYSWARCGQETLALYREC